MSPDVTSVYAPVATNVVPFWLVVTGLCLILPSVALAGHRLGSVEYRRRVADGVDRGLPGETSIGALLALLGLMLAFTFSSTLNWREGRTSAVVEEAAAIGTAFLRADILPDGLGRPLQEALLEYARTRVVPTGFEPSQAAIDTVVARSLEAQARLWPAMRAALGPAVPAPLQTFVAGGLTEVLDAHTRRAAAASKSIPAGTSALLIFVAAAGVFAVGNRSALQGRQITWRTSLVSLVLAGVLVTIEDLDRPTDGITSVNQNALLAAIADMEASLETGA
jgi:hypothetical protein